MTDPAAGQRLRALLERSKGGDETWDEVGHRLGLTGKSALFRWFSGNEPSGGGFKAIARVTGTKRWEVVRTWDGD